MPRSVDIALAAVLAAGTGCATVSPPPPAVIMAGARSSLSYSARLRVTLKGPGLRGRTQALVGFRRPDALRVEIPGSAGARLVAVSREGTVTAVFPGEGAVFRGPASPEALESLLGVALSPPEIMDLLVGTRPTPVRTYDAKWGASLPREITATLADGTRLEVVVEEAEAGGVLPAAAFEEPPSPGYRSIGAAEARGLWSGR